MMVKRVLIGLAVLLVVVGAPALFLLYVDAVSGPGENPEVFRILYASADYVIPEPLVLFEPGDEAVFVMTVTVGPDVEAFKSDSDSVFVGFGAFEPSEFEGHLDHVWLDLTDPDNTGWRGPPRILTEECVGGCVKVIEYTVTWSEDEGAPRGLPPGVPLELQFRARAKYLIAHGAYDADFDGVAPPEDLTVEVEVVSAP